MAELDARLHRIEDHLEQPPNPDWEDGAQEAEMDEVLEGLGSAGQIEMEAIHAAIARIKAGTYGVCTRCGNDISSARLDVIPHTNLCRTCAAAVAQTA
ncbi:MAG: TraR/DksA family transcriptional regulator [Pseudomonadota bacterium]